MSALTQIYPRYRDRVSLVLIAHDLGEPPDTIREFMEVGGYPWPVYIGTPRLFSAYKVLAQSSAVALDPEGVIVFRKGYGGMPASRWERLFQDLAGR